MIQKDKGFHMLRILPMLQGISPCDFSFNTADAYVHVLDTIFFDRSITLSTDKGHS